MPIVMSAVMPLLVNVFCTEISFRTTISGYEQHLRNGAFMVIHPFSFFKPTVVSVIWDVGCGIIRAVSAFCDVSSDPHHNIKSAVMLVSVSFMISNTFASVISSTNSPKEL